MPCTDQQCTSKGWVRRRPPFIPATGRRRQAELKFQTSQEHTEKPYLDKLKRENEERKEGEGGRDGSGRKENISNTVSTQASHATRQKTRYASKQNKTKTRDGYERKVESLLFPFHIYFCAVEGGAWHLHRGHTNLCVLEIESGLEASEFT